MKRYSAILSNGLECIVVADSFSQASLCVAHMLFNTDEYRREDSNPSLRVGDAYTIEEIEMIKPKLDIKLTPAQEIVMNKLRRESKITWIDSNPVQTRVLNNLVDKGLVERVVGPFCQYWALKTNTKGD